MGNCRDLGLSPGLVERHRTVLMIEYQPAHPAVGAEVARSAGLSSKKIIIAVFMCLIAGHLAIKAYFGSVVINAAGIVLVSAVFYWILYVKKGSVRLSDRAVHLLTISICQ